MAMSNPVPAESVGAVTTLDDVEAPDTAFRDAIPKLSAGEELFTRMFAVIALLYGLYWIIWRWSSSLNPQALIFSIVLIVAETYGLINSFFMIATVWKLKYRDPPPAPKGLKVDVFIELRRAARGAAAYGDRRARDQVSA